EVAKPTPASAPASSPAVSTPAGTTSPAAVPAAPAAAPTSTPASVTPLRGTMTEPQLTRVLSRTRGVQIPDEVVRQHTASFTKVQASELINEVDRGDFSAVERRDVKSVPLPATA